MPVAPTVAERDAITYLRTAGAIRERSENVLKRGLDGDLDHFSVHLDRLGEAADVVIDVTRETYPELDIPGHSRWGHFGAGGVDRLQDFYAGVADCDTEERARSSFDLVITSVLLDAGAGEVWTYHERETGQTLRRSEGLAVASLRMFLQGDFSADKACPLRADAAAIESTDQGQIEAGFQASERNPLVGLSGRVGLLRSLGRTLRTCPAIFGVTEPRVGTLFDYLRNQARDGQLAAAQILTAVLEGLGPIWPGRVSLGGVNLGDVGAHSAAGGTGPGAGLVPFHKLSQWLSYSLIEPLQKSGLEVVEIEALTGLPEYRNGGLLVDLNVLELKDEEARRRVHAPESEIIVEWRALTVALLDRLADVVRTRLGVDSTALPLAKILEGGTWRAGRRIASERRTNGSPPIQVMSDGTIF